MSESNYSRRDVLRGLGGLAFAPAVPIRPFVRGCLISNNQAEPNFPIPVPDVEAYSQKSVVAGSQVDFRISSPHVTTHTVSLIRLGWKADGTEKDWTIESATLPQAPGQKARHAGSYIHIEKAIERSASIKEFTAEMWVRPMRTLGSGQYQGLITQHTFDQKCGFGLFLREGNRMAAYFGTGGLFDPLNFLEDTGTGMAHEVTQHVWHHVGVTFDSGIVIVYLDGNVAFSGTVAVGAFTPGKAPLRIGAYGAADLTNYFFDGDIAMPAIYDAVLVEADFEARFDPVVQFQIPPVPPTHPSVIGCWPLSEEAGDSVADVSPCGRDGVIVNHATWMIGGPSFDASQVTDPYDPATDTHRGHGLRLSAADLYDCGWDNTQSFVIPEDCLPGIYVGRIKWGTGTRYDVTFVVRRAPSRPPAPIVVLCSTNTWLAYNRSMLVFSFYQTHPGGHPTYYQGHEMPWSKPGTVTFPFGSADPYSEFQNYPAYYSHLVKAERHLHIWLEQNGYDFDVISDRDLHETPGILDEYKTMFIAGHSEYWTNEAQTRVHDFVAGGKTLIVASGNTMFWRVTMDSQVMECRKWPNHVSTIPNVTLGEAWHEHDQQRGGLMRQCANPAWTRIGIECQGYGGALLPMQVTNPGHSFFQTPELINLSSPQIGGAEAVGHEWDVSRQTITPAQTMFPIGYTAPVILGQGIGNSSNTFDYNMVFALTSVPAVVCEMVDWLTGTGRVFAIGSINAGASLHADEKMPALFRNVLHQFGVEHRMYGLALGTNGLLQVSPYGGTGWGGLIQDSTSSVGTNPPIGVQWSTNSLAIFVISSGAVRWRKWTGAGWSPWSALSSGATFSGRPAVVGWARKRMDLFAIDNITGDLFWNAFNGTVWSGWILHGTTLGGDPAAVSWEGNNLSIAARVSGSSGTSVRYREYIDNTWQPWRNLGGSFTIAPTLLTWGGKNLSLFEVDSAGALVWKLRFEGVWQQQITTWDSLGKAPDAFGVLNMVPLDCRVHAAAFMPDHLAPVTVTRRAHIKVVARGSDNRMKVNSFDGTTWTWQDIGVAGGGFVGEPAITTYRGKYMSVMSVAVDGALWRIDWNGTAWSAWQSMGGSLAPSPGMFSWVMS